MIRPRPWRVVNSEASRMKLLLLSLPVTQRWLIRRGGALWDAAVLVQKAAAPRDLRRPKSHDLLRRDTQAEGERKEPNNREKQGYEEM